MPDLYVSRIDALVIVATCAVPFGLAVGLYPPCFLIFHGARSLDCIVRALPFFCVSDSVRVSCEFIDKLK